MEVNTHNEDDNKKLFADSMIHYTNICHDIKGLNSYWKANQAQLDALKVSHPDSQFCGDEHWLSIKAAERLDKLKQLGI